MPEAIRAYCRRSGQPVPETDGALARCCLESLSLKYRMVLDALESLVQHRLNTIRVVGGGSRNRLLCQFTADCCRRPVAAGPVEASALGNVMVQAVATGHLESIAAGRERIAASCELVHYEPRSADQDRWDEAYEKFRRLCAFDPAASAAS
jgi:rhamnulokinase